ncbi:4-hydroxythreonine-4-phosphate dehydrogenase PdxA [Reyranella sp. CPCC 100927]|uniref:4-hydroxythreonine-4-phosphate dehydrogenase PdxA n=1 Tax=Reyranella sp. CPCC 100927 TaxID=2599616 RepID=UPI0011B85D4F|nr:4-hydroxythreonine-4-phosphate dehydrogenase PdxA [Reyranella sp. CPCC 100927]TWT03857.1 4-hydroxythreonine-4-phosphate dehydrogenase PdxA [Reyranella sp. CPCC 100927]
MKPTATLAPVAVTMGEPAGIGGELTLKAWQARRSAAGALAFFAVDDPDRLRRVAQRLDLAVDTVEIATPAEAPGIFAHALPVMAQPLAVPDQPGHLDVRNAGAVIASIERAARLARDGSASAVVTNPIQKKTLQAAGFPHPGHTEFLAALGGAPGRPADVVMMLACRTLRVVPVTIHVALRRALDILSTDLIVQAGRIAADAMRRDFGLEAPRLAVAGLNPHAGEGRTMGDEDADIVAPAVAALRAAGIDATGPLPPDTMFHEAARARYDLALCMYHDQALIPIKTIDFAGGVNVTLGLPFIRTSPDHGTALDIAGTGAADPSSLLAALDMAADMAHRRALRAIAA